VRRRERFGWTTLTRRSPLPSVATPCTITTPGGRGWAARPGGLAGPAAAPWRPTFGILDLRGRTSDAPLSQEEIQTLAFFATQAALALDHARRAEADLARLQRSAQIGRAVTELGKSLDPDQIRAEAIVLLGELIPNDVAAILSIEEDTVVVGAIGTEHPLQQPGEPLCRVRSIPAMRQWLAVIWRRPSLRISRR